MFKKTHGKLFDIDREDNNMSTDSEVSSEEEAVETTDNPQNNSSQTADLEEENLRLKEKVLRLHADIENMQRRASEDRIKLLHEGTKTLAEKFLPAIDTLDLALGTIPKEIADHPWAEGIKQFDKLLNTALDNAGIAKMEITVNSTEFTPERHEALGQTPATDEIPSGSITLVYQPGYTFKGTTLRTAKVQVAL